MDTDSLLEFQKTKPKEGSGGVATFTWLFGSRYLFFATKHEGGLIAFLAFLAVGMFAAALIVGVLTYALERLILKTTIKFRMWNPSVLSFLGWLLLAVNITVTFVAARWTFDWLFAKPTFAAETQFAEFTDNQFNYVFQHPKEWKMKTPPQKQEGDLGETRVFIQGPRAAIMSIIGNIGTTVSKSQYDSNPNSDKIVNALIEMTVEQVYKKQSKALNASRMTVLESKVMPSEVGVKFYVSTLQFIDNQPPIAIIGTHLVPFEKPHMIVFLVSVIADKKMKEDQHLYDRIFKSFRLVGEAP